MSKLWTAEEIADRIDDLRKRVFRDELTTPQALLAAFNWGEDQGLKRAAGPSTTGQEVLRARESRPIVDHGVDRVRLRETWEELFRGLPEELRWLYRNDALFHAVVTSAVMRGATQLEMLIDAVKHLGASRSELMAAYSREAMARPLVVQLPKKEG